MCLTCCSCCECFSSVWNRLQPSSLQNETQCGVRSAEGFGAPFRCNHSQVAPGILVLLNGLKERLEVSCPEALKTEETPVQIFPLRTPQINGRNIFTDNQKIKCWWFVSGSLWCGSIFSYTLSSFPFTSAHPGEGEDAPVLTGRMGAGCHTCSATGRKPKPRSPPPHCGKVCFLIRTYLWKIYWAFTSGLVWCTSHWVGAGSRCSSITHCLSGGEKRSQACKSNHLSVTNPIKLL